MSRVGCRGEENSNYSSLFVLHSVSLVFHSSLVPRHSSLAPRSNRTRQNSDDLVEQFDSLLDHVLSEPVLHSFVTSPCFTSRPSCDVEKPNVLDSAQSTVTFLDVCIDRIRAVHLL